MATVRRSRSGPLAQCYSTDVIVVSQPAADALSAGPSIKRDRFSFRIGAMHRTSASMGIDLDNAEWEKKVMNSWPKMCTFVVREILQTERAYIASLEEIILGYMMPLHGYLLAKGEGPNFIHTVFGNINKLRQLHEELLDKLHTACGDPHEFADVFIETDFDHYREYCIHYTDANDFLQKSMNENEKLKMFITQCQNDLEHALPLHSHLIKPVQRILKYHLMLREMLKYIDSEAVIYQDVKEAHGKMKSVAEEINTSFKKERTEQLATPSSIARRRSKEIKSLQKSRSSQRSPSPEKVFDLQRSMEFEDSLDIIRVNMNSVRHGPTKSVGSRRRHPRPPLTQFIAMFESSKLAAPAAGGLCAPLPPSRPSPPPKATALHSPSPNQSLAPDQRALPGPSSPSHVDRPLSSSSESSSDGSSGRTSSREHSPCIKNPKQVRKTPLTLRKSLPVVQRSKAQAHGERGDRNSVCDSAHSHLVESQALLGNSDKTGDSGTAKPSTTPEPVIKPEGERTTSAYYSTETAATSTRTISTCQSQEACRSTKTGSAPRQACSADPHHTQETSTTVAHDSTPKSCP
ncbi:Pleckstrin homology domain-containing family G member 3 [Geodia barretti]|uniref:Pleckstrin homology domain-containing family G member 3 n=1 Tax=Geodia barretti TaxID=519541 RepID=A0AA35SN50_GEOBA|nr:Pleckstrin homology domain-containing family G member 3 [Geodia barretti]